MASVYVQEFAGLAATPSGDAMLPVPAQPPLASYTVSNATGPNQGPKYQPATKWLLIESDAVCSVRVDGTNAAATDMRIAATWPPLLFQAPANGNVSVITNT
jgi:hypothetical protein